MSPFWNEVTVFVGGGAAQSARFRKARVAIGRDSACDVFVDDDKVSRRHAEIRIGDQQATFVDRDSTNGTYFKGRQIAELPLLPGETYALALGSPNGALIEVRFGPEAKAWHPPHPTGTRQTDAGGPNRRSPAAPASVPATVEGGAPSRNEARAHDADSPVIAIDVLVARNPTENRTACFRKSLLSVGRSRNCDLVLPESCDEISGLHLELRWDGRQLWLVDQNSTNGTTIAGEKVRDAAILQPTSNAVELSGGAAKLLVRYQVPSPPSGSPSLPSPPAAARLSSPVFGGAVEVGVIGVAGVGKSSLLNALVAPGTELLPAGGVGSLTALPIRIVQSTQRMLRIRYKSRSWLQDALRMIREERSLAPDLTGRLSLLCTGDQHLIRDNEWLGMALRFAMHPDVGRPPDETQQTIGALKRLNQILPLSGLERVVDPTTPLPEFLRTIEEHAAGQFAPMCESIEIGWDAGVLADGVVLVDLPGLGSLHDAHASATVEWLRAGRAALIVVDRSGLPEVVLDTLRSSGFTERWRNGNADLILAVTKLDLVVDDVVREAEDGTPWAARFASMSERAIELALRQLSSVMPEWGERARPVSICPVSAREAHRLATTDHEDKSQLASVEATGFARLRRALRGAHDEPRALIAPTETARMRPEWDAEVTSVTLLENMDDRTQETFSVTAFESLEGVVKQWERWLDGGGRTFIERAGNARLSLVEGGIAAARELLEPSRRELPICFLGNSGVGKSTLINALIDPEAYVVPQGGIGPLTAQATVVRFAEVPHMRVSYHGARRLNQLVFALDRHCERMKRCDVADDNPLDEAAKQDALLAVPTADASDEDRSAVESRIQAYISQARVMVSGTQFGEAGADDVAYLADSLRSSMGRPPLWDFRPLAIDKERIEALARAVALGHDGAYLEATANRRAFLDEVRRHASGSISPLVKSLEVGWRSSALRSGIVSSIFQGSGSRTTSTARLPRNGCGAPQRCSWSWIGRG